MRAEKSSDSTQGEDGSSALKRTLSRRSPFTVERLLASTRYFPRRARTRGKYGHIALNERTGTREKNSVIRGLVERGSQALRARASSVFILSANGEELAGTCLFGWDWTRTSFVAELADWPNVQRAIAAKAPVYFAGDDARSGEVGWFEPDGVGGVLCVPLAIRDRVLGVVFFDYGQAAELAPVLDVVRRRGSDRDVLSPAETLIAAAQALGSTWRDLAALLAIPLADARPKSAL